MVALSLKLEHAVLELREAAQEPLGEGVVAAAAGCAPPFHSTNL